MNLPKQDNFITREYQNLIQLKVYFQKIQVITCECEHVSMLLVDGQGKKSVSYTGLKILV